MRPWGEPRDAIRGAPVGADGRHFLSPFLPREATARKQVSPSQDVSCHLGRKPPDFDLGSPRPRCPTLRPISDKQGALGNGGQTRNGIGNCGCILRLSNSSTAMTAYFLLMSGSPFRTHLYVTPASRCRDPELLQLMFVSVPWQK